MFTFMYRLYLYLSKIIVAELGSKMATEDNGNVGLLKPTSSSNEDLSEYTDADESISAPTEFLAEVNAASFILVLIISTHIVQSAVNKEQDELCT